MTTNSAISKNPDLRGEESIQLKKGMQTFSSSPLYQCIAMLIQYRMSKTSVAWLIHTVTLMMQDRLAAFPAPWTKAWRITFDLKRTKEQTFCCRNCDIGIITVVGSDEWAKSPRISYQCASQMPAKVKTMAASAKTTYLTNEAAIAITHRLGKFFLFGSQLPVSTIFPPHVQQDPWKNKTSNKLRMLSSVTIDCQVTKIVMNPGDGCHCHWACCLQ